MVEEDAPPLLPETREKGVGFGSTRITAPN
jgi:hypothetical protein